MRMISSLLIALSLAACGKKQDADQDKAPGTQPAKDPGGAPPGGGAVEVSAVDVVAGVASACALMKDGGARCWGRTDVGETGGKMVDGQAATPVAVAGVAGATALFGGGDPGDTGDTYCVLGGGKVTCWGHPQVVPLRTAGEGAREIAPLAGATQLAFGTGFGLALMPDGSVQSWGTNVFKQRGVDGLTAHDEQAQLAAVPGITGAKAIAAGQTHACALLADGTASCWGYHRLKQGPTPVPGVTGLTAIHAGGDDTCGLLADGKVTCWGADGQQRALAGVEGAAELAMRGNGGCARTTAGAVWCWERYADPAPVAGLSGATAVSVAFQSRCAVTGDGKVHCWGYNRYGQLGDGTLVDRDTPAAVASINAKTLPATVDGTAKVSAPPAQTWDDVPADCKHGPLTVKWPRLGGDNFPVESAVASVRGEGKTVAVTLSNHGVDPADPGARRRGKQVGISVRFARVDLAAGKAPMAVDPGTYSQDLQQDRLIYVSAADRAADNIMLSSMGLAGPDAGTVTLSKLDGAWVCGELAIKTKEASITGPFAAKIAK